MVYTYDIGGRNTSITTPRAKENGKVSQKYTYDAQGYVSSITDGEGPTARYKKDMWGRTLTVTDPYGVVSSYTYDHMGNVTRTTDGNGNPTTYTYNTLNELASITDAQGLKVNYKYDRQGRLTRETDRNGNLISYSYNSDNHLIGKVALGVQEYEKYLYNRDGSLLAAINNNSVETYSYTPNGYINSEARNGKTILEYRIDKNGRVTRVTDAEGDYTGYTYDIVGRIKSVVEGSKSEGSDVTATYSYNTDNTIASIDYASGIKAAYDYDSDKNISYLINKNPDGSILEYYDYSYDNRGNQLTKTENGITTTYAYDKLNRLVKENGTTYTYDNAGNRLTKTDDSASISYAYDQKNRLTRETAGDIITTYSYDNNGNLTEKSDGTGYDYNAFNQLLESSNVDGSWQLNIYDAIGLRMAMVENGSYTQFTYDRGNLIGDYDKDENKKTRYTRGYDLLSQQNGEGTTSYYLHNGHGDVTKLVDGNGSALNSYSYDAFGNTVSYECYILGKPTSSVRV